MVLITGCNGLLGRTLAKNLMSRNIPVRGLDFWKVKESPEVTEFFEGSILDIELVQKACEGVDTVYHLLDIENSSHYSRRFMKKVNINGTENILMSALENSVKKVIFLSTAKVYGQPDEMSIKENDKISPDTPYGKDKVKAEKICTKYIEQNGMNITIFRPTTIAGPGIDDTMILIILYMALGMDDSNRLYIAGDGDSRYQLVHPEDVVSAFILAAATDSSRGKVYNLGSDCVPTQMEEVVKVKELAGLNCSIKHLSSFYAKVLSFILRPLNINYLRKEHLVFILSNFYLDCEKAKMDLKWLPAKDNIQIFLETINWYRSEKL